MSDEVVGKSLTYVETDLDVYRVTIFENDPVASGLPLNWSSPWGPITTPSVTANADMPSGRALRIIKTSGNRAAAMWDAVPAIRDVSVVALFRSLAVGLTNMGIVLRGSGGDLTDTSYSAVLRNDATVNIFRIVNTASVEVGVFAFPHGESENLWLRFDALDVTGGVLLRVKAWRGDVDDEPEEFLGSVTNTDSVLLAGKVGLFISATNTPDFALGFFRARSLFSNTTETLRFTKSTSYLPDDIDAVPSLLEVQVSPGAISLGENLGERATLTAAFKDHRHADLGELFDRGTYWGKFRARGLFRRGEPIRMIRGLLGQSLGEMETRHYVLDSFDGPAFGGAFQLVGKDPLKLADDDRALAPRPSLGSLVTDILAADTLLTVTPAGAGNAGYPATGYVAVGGKEVMAFQRGGNDSFTKSLLHFNGADASTTFTDSNLGGSAKTWTASGNAQIDTAIFKFATAAGLFDGTGDFISTPDHADFTLGSNDFTIECWFNCTATGGSARAIFGQSDNGFSATSRALRRNTSNTIEFIVSGGPAALVSTTQFTNVINPGWHHVAVVRSGTQFMLFIDGVLEASVTSSFSFADSTFSIFVGERAAAADPWQGSLDEFRFTNGAARYTDDFVPVGPFNDSGDVFSLVRGLFGTTAINHSAEDRVQLCLYYFGMSPADVIFDLFTTYAGIDPAIIPLANWQTEVDTFLDRLYTKMIADPVGVKELVSNLIKQAGLAVWWDSLTQEIRLQVLRGVSTDAFRYDQRNTLAGTIAVGEQPDKRITQVWTYYGVRNPLVPLDQQDNYRSGLVTVDLEAELLNGGAVIKVINADWIPAFGRSTAERINDLNIGRFVVPPRRVAFDVMRYSGVEDPQLGGGYRLEYWGAQNEYGAQTDIPLQVTRLTPMADRFRVEGEEMLFTQQSAADLINRTIVFDSNTQNVNVKTVHDSIYPTMTAQDVIDGVNLTVIVAGGVVVGSNHTTLPAMTIGTGWPVGADITVVVNGDIEGMGGQGGFGGIGTAGGDGEDAGTALFTRIAIDLDLSSGGRARGGGGGGGGGGFSGFFFNGMAGGGGAGVLFGSGGVGPPSDTGGHPPTDGTDEQGGEGGQFGGSPGVGDGGDGGDPGQPGQDGTDWFFPGGDGGAAGSAIDGVSFVTITLGAGSIVGPQVN